MGDAVPDINVSNGTCYFAENTVTKGDFIPCGNVAYDDWPCCHTGSLCLGLGDANACWDPVSKNTYMAGCTDPGFNSPACYRKPAEFHEQEWVAIKVCNKGTGNNDTQWGGCKVDDNSTELIRLPGPASCDPYCSSAMYVGAMTISAFASLPTRAAESIQWTGGFNPATRAASMREPGSSTATASSSLSTSRAATVTPPPTATPAPVPGEDSGLSTGAKAGIGVGMAGAVLLLVAVVLLALLVRRRRRTSEKAAEDSHDQDNMGPEQTRYHNESHKQPWVAQLLDASPYAPYKAELPAEERRAYQVELPAEENGAYQAELPAKERRVYQAELPADQNIMPEGDSDVAVVVGWLSPHASPHPSSLTAYSPYLPYSGASPSPAASQAQVSPQTTGERNGHEDQPPSNPGSMSRHSELHG